MMQMLILVGWVLIAVNLFLRIIIFKIEKQNEYDWHCETCMYGATTSNQHPNMCDDCDKGNHYCNWLEGGYKG